MKADTVIRMEGIDALIAALGEVNAERFISLINRDEFDYTEWRSDNLCKDMTIEEIYEAAVALERSGKQNDINTEET